MKILELIVIGVGIISLQCIAQPRLSPTPTLAEIKKAFVELHSTKNDLFTSLSTIIQRKDAVVPALRDYINAFSLKDEETGIVPNRLYGVLALEGIATEGAFNVLLQTALLHPETEVKGKALQIIASNYYDKVMNDSLVPSKDIVNLFLRNCDDTTYVELCQKRMGEIAREGMKTWTGMDFGDLRLDQKKIIVGKSKTEMTMPEYRDWWWNKHQLKIKWNAKKTMFEVRE